MEKLFPCSTLLVLKNEAKTILKITWTSECIKRESCSGWHFQIISDLIIPAPLHLYNKFKKYTSFCTVRCMLHNLPPHDVGLPPSYLQTCQLGGQCWGHMDNGSTIIISSSSVCWLMDMKHCRLKCSLIRRFGILQHEQDFTHFYTLFIDAIKSDITNTED